MASVSEQHPASKVVPSETSHSSADGRTHHALLKVLCDCCNQFAKFKKNPESFAEVHGMGFAELAAPPPMAGSDANSIFDLEQRAAQLASMRAAKPNVSRGSIDVSADLEKSSDLLPANFTVPEEMRSTSPTRQSEGGLVKRDGTDFGDIQQGTVQPSGDLETRLHHLPTHCQSAIESLKASTRDGVPELETLLMELVLIHQLADTALGQGAAVAVSEHTQLIGNIESRLHESLRSDLTSLTKSAVRKRLKRRNQED